MNIKVEELVRLQARKERIRNICVLAHVDHGKTSLSDNLIGSNGLIHSKMMGELRYLDFKEEEQKRGITMKSSSISLLYCPRAVMGPEGLRGMSPEARQEHGYLVNLIDSPGHVDFCSEVSTAVRLSDGCVVVVDAVEGVCVQTHAVMRQAFEEKVTPCLLLNKVDRLILELRLTPMEAYQRLMAAVTHANMVMSAMQSEKHLREADAVMATAAAATAGLEDIECSSEEDVFQPSKGNVAFGSAVDGWGFRVDQMAAMWAEKVGANPNALARAMWGDWGLIAKEKRIVRANKNKLKPLFVQLALEPIWKAYSVCDGEPASAVLQPIVRSRGLTGITDKMLQQADSRQALKAVLRAWLPVSEAVLGMAATHLPSPQAAAADRLPRLLTSPPDLASLPERQLQQLSSVETAVLQCDSQPTAPVVVFVSKMVAVPSNMVPRLPGETGHSASDVFMAFARVMSGILHVGQRVHVLSTAYSPAQPNQYRQTAVAEALYLMMGQSLERVQAVPAGNLVAIAGLEQAILKSATLASTPVCTPLARMSFQAAPIMRVAVEPVRPSDLPSLMQGLSLLNRADPLVEVSYGESGEVVVGAAGEVHLETCMKELEERFAKVPIQVSPPLVAFRESVFQEAEAPETTTAPPSRVVEASVASGVLTVRVKALPLPAPVASALETASDQLRGVISDGGHTENRDAGSSSGMEHDSERRISLAGERLRAVGTVGVESLLQQLNSAVQEDKALEGMLQRIWLLGPRGVGPNLLLKKDTSSPIAASGVVTLAKGQSSRTQNFLQMLRTRAGDEAEPIGAADEQAAAELITEPLHVGSPTVSERLGLCSPSTSTNADESANGTIHSQHETATHAASEQGRAHVAVSVGSTKSEYRGVNSEKAQALVAPIEAGIVAGFQLATSSGPLCDEDMWGVAFELEVILQRTRPDADYDPQEDVYGPLSGQVMTSVSAACRRAVLEAGPRLVEAMSMCQVVAEPAALAGAYAVLGRRRGRIVREDMNEGSGQFVVGCYLPMAASFGLADELRRRCSGAATASLMLSHWERLQVDPFFVPTTDEEREEFGEEATGSYNVARTLIDDVRRRKGLPVADKVVEKATKQRTVKRNV